MADLREQFSHLLEESSVMGGGGGGCGVPPDALPNEQRTAEQHCVGTASLPTQSCVPVNYVPYILVFLGVVVAFVAYMHRDELVQFCKGDNIPPRTSPTNLRSEEPYEYDDDAQETHSRGQAANDPMFDPL